MRLDKKTIDRIMKKYKDTFDKLEYYDRTHKKLWGRERIDITLNRETVHKLKVLKEKRNVSVSRLVEEAVLQRL